MSPFPSLGALQETVIPRNDSFVFKLPILPGTKKIIIIIKALGIGSVPQCQSHHLEVFW